MTRTQAILLAGFGSMAVLLGAFAFQHIGGLAPCKMCLWQRWPHAAALPLAALSVAIPGALLPILGLLSALITAGIGVYHTGVERDWWEGPTSCSGTGPGLGGMSGSDLLSLDSAPALVMCDQVSWSLIGLSMASWNTVASLVIVAFWIQAIAKSR